MRYFFSLVLMVVAGHAATLSIVTAQAPAFPAAVIGAAQVSDEETAYFTVLTPSVVDLDSVLSVQMASLNTPHFQGSTGSGVLVEFEGSILYDFSLAGTYTESGSNLHAGPTQALNQLLQPGVYTVSAGSLDGVGIAPFANTPLQATQIGDGLASLSLNVQSGDVIPGAPEPSAWVLGGLGSLGVLATALQRRYRRSQGLGC